MKIEARHRWRLPYHSAVAVQKQLRDELRLRPLGLQRIRHVAGCDVAISKRLERLYGAVVVMSFPDLETIETRTASMQTLLPYIPGLLSFREIPVLAACLRRVKSTVDVILCDGHGIAHPRGLGLASHLGLLAGLPTIGCAKSVLVGEYDEPDAARGAFTPLTYDGRRVGSAVRTRDGVKPMFISPGHLVDQRSALRIALACASGYRLPEPTRQADQLAGQARRQAEGRG